MKGRRVEPDLLVVTHGNRAISANTALRLAKYFGASPQFWLNLQTHYDLELEKDKSYRLHLSSMDWLHGFSIQPINVNLEVVPGYEMVLTITPDTSGEQTIICNEFCGIGHHNMLGKIYVTEGGS